MAHATSPAAARQLVEASRFFVEGMKEVIFGPNGIDELAKFASGAESRAHDLSRQATKDIGNDEDGLTNHAARMRSVAASVVLLRDGYVPALKIDKENAQMRLTALELMGYLHAQFQSMEYGL